LSEGEPVADLPLAPLIHTPDPTVAATLARLEHFLAAIQHARHA
jgi:hypothetical protein